jgi:hypothetical protein
VGTAKKEKEAQKIKHMTTGQARLHFKIKAGRFGLWFQASYYTITALWPMIDIGSFMEVTGPKADTWLVKLVALLLLVISLAIVTGLRSRENYLVVRVLSISSCFVLAAVDIYYVYDHVISPVYMADAALELLMSLIQLLCLNTDKIIKESPGRSEIKE